MLFLKQTANRFLLAYIDFHDTVNKQQIIKGNIDLFRLEVALDKINTRLIISVFIDRCKEKSVEFSHVNQACLRIWKKKKKLFQ